MASDMTAGSPKTRYGPAGLVAAVANILVVQFATWIFLPYFLLTLFALPILLVDLAVAGVLASRPGRWGVIGRGMLIGWLAGPLSLLLFIPAYFAVNATGLI